MEEKRETQILQINTSQLMTRQADGLMYPLEPSLQLAERGRRMLIFGDEGEATELINGTAKSYWFLSHAYCREVRKHR